MHSLHLEVCVEGHDTDYDLHGVFVLGYLPRCLVLLTLDLRLVRDCDHWFVLMYVIDDMVIPLSLSSISFYLESLGDYWGPILRVVLAGY